MEGTELIFTPTPLRGAFVVDIERREDGRGFFARSFCQDEFREHGLNPIVAQCNVTFNDKRGTLRGMHYQAEPHQEDKLVRCTQGVIWDVIIDLRKDSPSFKRSFSVELSATSRNALYVPKGLAHGFQSLTNDSEVIYMMGEPYHPDSARGVRWDDDTFRIDWPIPNPILSDRDRSFPVFVE